MDWEALRGCLPAAPVHGTCRSAADWVRVARPRVELPILQVLDCTLRLLPRWVLASALQPSEHLPRNTEHSSGEVTRGVCALGLPTDEQAVFVHQYLQPSHRAWSCAISTQPP